MRGRHHIYNFHIGFWGAFLVSLTLMFHSAVLLLASAGITVAQTAPFILLSSPTNGQLYQQGDTVSLSATTSSAVADLEFKITSPAITNDISRVGTPDPTFTDFNSSVVLTVPGTYTVEATATNPQTGDPESVSAVITVNSGVVLDVNIENPSLGDILVGQEQLRVSVNPTPDSALFRFSSQSGSVQDFQAVASQGTIWVHDLDSTLLQDDSYTLVAIASLSGEETSSTSIQVSVQNTSAVQETFTLTDPSQGQIVSGTNVNLAGDASSAASNVNFQITPGASSTQDIIPADNPSGNLTRFQSSFDSTNYPNGDYSILIFGTINGETVFSDVVGFTINNQATGTPPSITTTSLPDAQVGIPYTQTITATGGTTPLVWSVSPGSVLPPSLSINGNTGIISGVPTQEGVFPISLTVTDLDSQTDSQSFNLTVGPAPAAPATCGDGTVDTGEQCDDGNTTSGDGCSAICTNETTPPPANAPASLTITQPPANAELQGTSSLIIMTGSEAIAQPSVLLVDSAGQNILAGSNTQSFKPVQNNGDRIWHYLLDTTPYENGSYSLRMVTTAQDDGATISAGPITVTINNAVPEPVNVFTGGTIIRPTEGQGVSGIVLLQAQISGDIRSVTFNLQTVADGTKIVTGVFNQARNLYEATWDTAGIRAGSVVLQTNIVTTDGQQATLPNRQFNLIAETDPIVVQAPTPNQPLPEPRPEELIPNEVLSNVDENGQVLQVAIECQIVGITTAEECDDYLASRAIRVLDEGEREVVSNQLDQIVSRHIQFDNGEPVQRDFRQPEGQGRSDLSQPLSEILPINPELARESSFLVAPSTRPPANISRFVEQTVDAVLVIDDDGDGLSDDAEQRYGTDPNNPDTDGDGFLDGEEVKNGFNPNGSGVLGIATAPADIAILNNRPLDQPRFAGVTAETISVQQVVSPETEEAQLNIRGKAEPNSFVTLYIYSSLPVVVTVQANQSGDWEYDFTHPLVDGKHDVYATVTNDTGKIVKKSRPLSFFVQEARAVNEEDFLNATLTVQDDSNIFLAYYMVGGILIVLLGGVMFFYYLRAQKGFS